MIEQTTQTLSKAATRLAGGVFAGSLLIGGVRLLSALIRTGAIGRCGQ